ncbi:sulfur carrier protein ThiS [Longirhabdus pacifica]|uniref:sulfur carrier protein ThiS n=1 Tax=Longirhabdus pacifica TaxID=2305227 RepID=UPI00100909F7|nr:sulfur carrier protein ThiS [Longirhabdus pacifica]
MNIIINGETYGVPTDVQTVEQLLLHLQLQHKVMIVERNEEILGKEAHAHTQLTMGDKIEIVHFVGGG